MDYVLAILPILVVLSLMLFMRWGGQRAGPVGWLVGLMVACLNFGQTWDIWWVSQVKGLLLSLNVLLALWSALFLYYLVDRAGGIAALANSLRQAIADHGLLLIIISWIFSGLVESLTGLGLPMAIVAPMIAALGVSPLTAVASSAVGHAWAVTFGNMGVVFQTLIAVSGIDAAALAPGAALLMGAACAACGLGSAWVLGQIRRWRVVLLLACVMAGVQYFMATSGLATLSAFFAALAGILGGVWISRKLTGRGEKPAVSTALIGALLSYGLVMTLLIATTVIYPLKVFLGQVVWSINFPEVITSTGIKTPAGNGQIFRPLLHSGTLILISALAGYRFFRRRGLCPPQSWKTAWRATWSTALPATIGVISMVGLSTMMEHCGMTLLLARGLSQMMGTAFPLLSPMVGILGAFATGSNNNSNVLFAGMQKNIALLLNISPVVLLSAQTAGGALGSMLAPAKLMVGCSTTGLKGQDGKVLRITLPIGIAIGLSMGLITLIMSLLW